MGGLPAEEQNLTAAEEAFQCAYRAGHYKAPYMVRPLACVLAIQPALLPLSAQVPRCRACLDTAYPYFYST